MISIIKIIWLLKTKYNLTSSNKNKIKSGKDKRHWDIFNEKETIVGRSEQCEANHPFVCLYHQNINDCENKPNKSEWKIEIGGGGDCCFGYGLRPHLHMTNDTPTCCTLPTLLFNQIYLTSFQILYN